MPAPRIGPQVVAVVDGAPQAVRVGVDDGGREVQVLCVGADHVPSLESNVAGAAVEDGGPKAHYIGGGAR